MSRKEKSIGVNALLNGMKTLLSVVFPLITYPYAARVLQVENMGKIDFSNSVVNYFVLLAGLGISTYAIREGSRVRDNKEKLNQFASEVFTINTISSFISMIGLAVVIYLVPRFHEYSVLMFVQSLSIFGNLIGVTWLYSVNEDYAYITIRSLIVHLVALLLLFTFVHDQDDYILYAATTVIANVGANVFNFFHARKYVSIRLTSQLNLRKHIKPILIIFASAVTTTIYVNSDKTILGFLSDEYHVGLYSTAVNVYSITKSLVAAVILVSLPRLSNYYANKKSGQYVETATNIYKSALTLLLPMMVGIFVTADEIIMVVGGESYLPAATSLRILGVSLVFSIIATFYTNAVLLPMKKESIVLKGTIISASVNVISNLLFIKLFQQNGAAFTTLIAEVIMCFYQYIYVRNNLKIKLSPYFIGSIVAGCTSFLLISLLCDTLINQFALNLGIKILLSIISYAFILIAMKNESVLQIFSEVKTKIHR